MSDPRDQRPEDGPQDEAESIAAEYVLGSLPLTDRIAAENLAKTNPGFAARIAAWEQHLAPLNDGYAEVPAPKLLAQIEARLFGVPAANRGSGLFTRLRGFLAGGAVAAGLAVAVFLALPSPERAAPPLTAILSAILAADAQALTFAAAYDPASAALTLTRTGGPAAEPGRTYELWVIEGTAAPVSLGVFDGADVTRPLATLSSGAVLAVSLEPTGGSTTGAPTGPVLVTGVFTLL